MRHTAGRAASCVLQCPTVPSLRHNTELCSGHSLAMHCAVWSVAPHSHDAGGYSPIRFMLDINLP